MNLLHELLTRSNANFESLSISESQSIENQWRAIYGNAFTSGSRVRHGTKAEFAYLAIGYSDYYIIPLTTNVPGIPTAIGNRNTSGVRVSGDTFPLGMACAVEFFVCDQAFEWSMIHTHEDHSLGGPYFLIRDWL